MFYQIIAVLIMIVFYGAYFIKLFQQHKRGIQTDLLGKGKIGFVKFIGDYLIGSYYVTFTNR